MTDENGIYASEGRYDLQEMVHFWAEKTPDRIAIQEQHRKITYSQLHIIIENLAIGLRSRGIGKGDVIVSALPNCYEAISVFFAAAKSGLVLVPCNSLSGMHEAEESICRSSPKAVFVFCSEGIEFIQDRVKDCLLISVGFHDERCISFSELLLDEAFEAATVNPVQDTLAIIFTSGSTGEPKGIELSYWSIFFSAYNYIEALGVDEADTFVMPMPLSHLFGLNAGVVLPICCGAKILLIDKFDPQHILALIEKEKASVLYGVPTMFAREIAEFKKNPTNLGSLRTGLIGGANCPAPLLDEIREVLGCNVVVGYGSTEAGSISSTEVNDPIEVVTKTVGKAFGNVKARIIDDQNVLREIGEGEFVCQGPCVMKGIYQQPEATAEIMKDGWVHTGDRVSIDTWGYIRVLGRMDNMIIRGGYNIYTAEIEQLYYANPSVLECCAVPIPHEELGQQICLAVRLVSDCPIEPEKLRKYAKTRIAKYKIPDYIFVFDELPKLSTGKMDAKKIADVCQERAHYER